MPAPKWGASVESNRPLNTIAPYYTMFRAEFPLAVLAGETGWVLDPFCGRGTTNYAARAHGMPSVGIDSSPVACAIAAAKLALATPGEVVSLATELVHLYSEQVQLPEGEFWDWAYERKTLREICAVRNGLCERRDPAAVILRAVMLGALHGPIGKRRQSYLSNQMPRTYATKPAGAVRFWESRGMRPSNVSLVEVVSRRASRALGESLPTPVGAVLLGDSRTIEIPGGLGPFRHVVTSPPYFGMRTYVSDQWLRNWFLGGPPNPDYAADRQMDKSSPDAFAQDLGRVWANVARHATPGCHMTIRFGAVPSVPSDPEAIALSSLQLANCGWRVENVQDAGAANGGKRQAEQFGFVRSKPITEIDVQAVLRG